MRGRKGNVGFWWGELSERDPIRRPRFRWEGNIQIDLQEVGWGKTDWIDLAQDRDR
jgi:hypothetical protein